MKSVGIVRRLDSVGRFVIPIELRQALHLDPRGDVEILVGDQGEIILRKHTTLKDAEGMAQACAEGLHETVGGIVVITDRDAVVTVVGAHANVRGQPVGPALDAVMGAMVGPQAKWCTDVLTGLGRCVVAPIFVGGNMAGTIIIGAGAGGSTMSDADARLVEAVARILGRVVGWAGGGWV